MNWSYERPEVSPATFYLSNRFDMHYRTGGEKLIFSRGKNEGVTFPERRVDRKSIKRARKEGPLSAALDCYQLV